MITKTISAARSQLLTAMWATVVSVLGAGSALAQTAPTAAPAISPPFMLHTWVSSLNAPLPAALLLAEEGIGPSIPALEEDLNFYGFLYSYQPGGATATATNAFFESLGTNGRSCATCHQPASGMSVSLLDIQARYLLSGPKDPIFAPVDGAVCPSAVPASYTAPSYLGGHKGTGASLAKAYSLILTRGVFRIFLPVPANAQFTISVASDPTGCNTNALYNKASDGTQLISVYRRPIISSNLKFKTIGIETNPANNFPALDPLTGAPLTIDTTVGDSNYGNPEHGNIMWDGREPTLESQAMDATLSHAQATTPPTTAQIAQMVAFELGIYSAQGYRLISGDLTSANGATGGPVNLYAVTPGQAASLAGGGITPYTSFSSVTGKTPAELQQESISRGQVIFNTRTFTINNVAGLTNLVNVFGPNNSVVGTCGTCHNQVNDGADAFPVAQHDLGISGDSPQYGGPSPATDLPIFTLTCPSATPAPNGALTVTTNDPGKALITGQCGDIGRTTVPQLRALASHPPYFHDGSAASLTAVLAFYQKRFPTLVLSAQDQTDLVNFLASL
jgi:cytochrome c peroxidase